MIKIKSVGMFWVENRVIRAQFSTFPTPMVPWPRKSHQNLTELFFNRIDGKR